MKEFTTTVLNMSLTVQQLLSDAKRLSSRLRDHDQSADQLITRAQEVLKEVDAMRQYQEDVDNLNEVAHNRPRAQLVLGIQQENRHIRTLQQENKELRAALEEHQSALELIMSKYRQHVTRLVNSPAAPDLGAINNHKNQLLAERTEKVCEMACVMKEAVRVDEETTNQQQELLARLITENKGLREMLEISGRGAATGRVKRAVPSEHKEVQTEGSQSADTVVHETVDLEVTLPRPGGGNNGTRPVHQPQEVDCITQPEHIAESGDSDETGSEDESVKYDTIKLADRRQLVKEKQNNSIPQERDNDETIVDANKETDDMDVTVTDNQDLVGSLVNELVVDTVDVSSSATSTSDTPVTSSDSIVTTDNSTDPSIVNLPKPPAKGGSESPTKSSATKSKKPKPTERVNRAKKKSVGKS